MGRLKKLKKLEVTADEIIDLKGITLIDFIIMTTLLTSSQIVRSCRQVEILRMDVQRLFLGDLTELEPAENTMDITLFWDHRTSIEEVLRIVNRWQQLCRSTLRNHRYEWHQLHLINCGAPPEASRGSRRE